MTYTLEAAQRRAFEAQQAADEEKAFFLFFRDERPELRNEANKDLVRDVLEGRRVTPGNIREAVAILEPRGQLAILTLTDQRARETQERVDEQVVQAQRLEALREELAGLHWAELERNPSTLAVIKELGKTVRQYRQDSFLKRIRRMNLGELEAKRVEFENAARLRSLSYEDLRVQARREYGSTHPQLGQQSLVSTIPSEYDYEFFLKLSPAKFREAVKLYGVDQINRRNRGEDAAEVRLRDADFERGLKRLREDTK
jgi:hypothetical protein